MSTAASITSSARQQAGLLGGKYRLGREIGRGGMSVVYEAQHAQLGQAFAVKILATSTNTRKNAFDRALLEARSAARLESEHAVRVFDIGLTPEGQPYVVMEKLAGRDLSQLVKGAGPLSIPDACAFVLQACDALAEAHGAGIIHRDLKPSNLFVTTRADGSPSIKVLDFGLVQHLETGPSSGKMKLVGTPGYASPEQLGMKDIVDARADIWALGVVLYVLVTGRRPFAGDNLQDALLSIVSSTVPPMTSPRGLVSPELQLVVDRCLAREPEHRFASCAELAAALVPFAPPQYESYLKRIGAAAYRGEEETEHTVEDDAARLSIEPASLVPTSRMSEMSESLAPDSVVSKAETEDANALLVAEVVRPPASRLGWLVAGCAVVLPALGFVTWIVAGHNATAHAHAPVSTASITSAMQANVVPSGSAAPTLLPPLPLATPSAQTPEPAAQPVAPKASARATPARSSAASAPAHASAAPPPKRAANPLTYR
jgi:eukaryotic-like serine/threonine-protein kinase